MFREKFTTDGDKKPDEQLSLDFSEINTPSKEAIDSSAPESFNREFNDEYWQEHQTDKAREESLINETLSRREWEDDLRERKMLEAAEKIERQKQRQEEIFEELFKNQYSPVPDVQKGEAISTSSEEEPDNDSFDIYKRFQKFIKPKNKK